MKYVFSIAISIALIINVVNTTESEFDILLELRKLFDLIRSDGLKPGEKSKSEQEDVATTQEYTKSKNEQIEADNITHEVKTEVKDYNDKDKIKQDYGEGIVDDDDYEDYDGDEIKDKPNYDINNAPQLFEKFIKDFNKKYKNNDDRDKHYQNFIKNLNEIIRINKESKSASADINQFADWSDKDFTSLLG